MHLDPCHYRQCLAGQGIHDGPTLCQANPDGSPNPNQCYRPSAAYSLNITKESSASYTLGGTVSGLSGTVVLQNNGSDALAINADGPFTFATPLPSGSTYSVTVQTQPANQTCSVSNGNGSINNANVTNVLVTCSTNTRTIGGNLSGLTGTVVLQNNGSDNLVLHANGAFTFPTPVAQGSPYLVTVLTQPSTQHCSVTNGSGTAGASNVTNVQVTCLGEEEFYVLNYDSNTVKVLNSTENLISQTITVENGPRTIAFTSDGSRALIGNQFSNSISIIDTATHQVTTTLAGITNPLTILITPDNTKAYVQPASPGPIQVINLLTFAVSSIDMSAVNGSTAISINPDGNTLYATGYNFEGFAPFLLVYINTQTDLIVNTVTVTNNLIDLIGSQSTSLDNTPDGRYLVVNPSLTDAFGTNNSFFIVNLSDNSVIQKPISFGGFLENSLGSTAISADSQRALISHYLTVHPVFTRGCSAGDVIYNFVTETMEPGGFTCNDTGLNAAVNNPAGDKFYFPTTINNTPPFFAVINNTLQTPTGIAAFSNVLNFMAFTQDGTRAYITDRGANLIYVFDAATNAAIATITTDVGTGPSMIARKP